MSKSLWMRFGRTGGEYSRGSLAPRRLTDEEMRPITSGLSALLEEAVQNGTFPNGAETPDELAAKGLIKGPADAQLTY